MGASSVQVARVTKRIDIGASSVQVARVTKRTDMGKNCYSIQHIKKLFNIRAVLRFQMLTICVLSYV